MATKHNTSQNTNTFQPEEYHFHFQQEDESFICECAKMMQAINSDQFNPQPVYDPTDLTFPMKTLGCPTYGLYAIPDSNIREKEALKVYVP